MSAPEGFARTARGGGAVAITHRGRPATTLRGECASSFPQDMEGLDYGAWQEKMACITGNDRPGDERRARRHPRNA